MYVVNLHRIYAKKNGRKSGEKNLNKTEEQNTKDVDLHSYKRCKNDAITQQMNTLQSTKSKTINVLKVHKQQGKNHALKTINLQKVNDSFVEYMNNILKSKKKQREEGRGNKP